MTLSETNGVTICADVGGSFIDLALVAGTAITSRERIPTPLDDWAGFVGIFRDYLAGSAENLSADAPVSIALAGLHHHATGTVISANIPCIHQRALKSDLAQALGRPIIITNDADCYALAEAGVGLAKGESRVFGVVLGTGVGGGLVIDGRLMTSAAGVGGEWGHGPIIGKGLPPGAPAPIFPCGCGQTGCLDTVGAARGMERLHQYLGAPPANSRAITAAWQAGDEAAGRTIAMFVDLLAGPLAMVLNLIPMNVVPVGGGLSNCQPLIAALDKAVRARMLAQPAHPLLRASELGGHAGLIGAALAARDHAIAIV